MDLAVEYENEEAAAVLRAHGALRSLHFAALKGILPKGTDEVGAVIAAGQDVNARNPVIFVCGWRGVWVDIAASLVYKSCIYIPLCMYIYIYIYIHTYILISICIDRYKYT